MRDVELMETEVLVEVQFSVTSTYRRTSPGIKTCISRRRTRTAFVTKNTDLNNLRRRDLPKSVQVIISNWFAHTPKCL
jgi:hypothetical protein